MSYAVCSLYTGRAGSRTYVYLRCAYPHLVHDIGKDQNNRLTD